MLAVQPLNLDNELTLFIHDALRFISAFIIPISQRVPHMYLSALPFAPEQSYVARKFRSRFPNTLVVTEGKPSQWPMVIFTAEHNNGPVEHVIFSLNESTFVSISGQHDRPSQTMYVCDSETGHCISGPFVLDGRGHGRDACFSPDGKRVLLEFLSYAVVWDIAVGEEQFLIEGHDFAFIDDGRIASAHWVDEDGDSEDSDDEDPTRVLVKFWDASNGALIPNRLLEVNDVALTRFSPDGCFLAAGRKSEDVIELWNLEDGKDPQRFPYPRGELASLHFSPTSDTLMAISGKEPCHIYLWRSDTQEMASFSYYSMNYHTPHVIHSPLTDYLFIQRSHRVEIWDVSTTGSRMIWETEHLVTPYICSVCPSRDGRRLLVGYGDRSVRMWNVDLEDLARNRADTADTQDDTDVSEVTTISNSGIMVVTESQQSHNVEFRDTNTGEIVARMDVKYEDCIEVAFSPDEAQVAFLSKSLITIYDIMHPEKHVSFNPWPRRDVWNWKVAFQTCNDLVIGAESCDVTLVLQVWHWQDWQDLAGFECTYSVDFKPEDSSILLAPDGLTVIFASHLRFNSTCYSWNHRSVQFDRVHFDDQTHVGWPSFSCDGKLFASWSDKDSCIRVWDTRTGQLISKFPTSSVDVVALSPALIDHSLGRRLIALRFVHENAIRLFDAYTGHLHAQILGPTFTSMTLIRDGTALACYHLSFGLRIWDITDLIAEHPHSTHGHEPMMQGMADGWVMGQDDEPLFWVPVEQREHLYVPPFRVVIEAPQISTILNFSKSRFGKKWTECIDKEWLRELEQKEKEVGKLLK